jgi:hypothetical protein
MTYFDLLRRVPNQNVWSKARIVHISDANELVRTHKSSRPALFHVALKINFMMTTMTEMMQIVK